MTCSNIQHVPTHNHFLTLRPLIINMFAYMPRRYLGNTINSTKVQTKHKIGFSHYRNYMQKSRRYKKLIVHLLPFYIKTRRLHG